MQSIAMSYFDFGMQKFAQMLQDVAMAQGTGLFGQSPNCHKFSLNQNADYEVFAVLDTDPGSGGSVIAYRVKQEIANNTITMEVSTQSDFHDAFDGVLLSIISGGCDIMDSHIILD
jgi:hypothetical protein